MHPRLIKNKKIKGKMRHKARTFYEKKHAAGKTYNQKCATGQIF